jgi:hypothetical protein
MFINILVKTPNLANKLRVKIVFTPGNIIRDANIMKGKCHPKTDHESPETEYSYSCTLSLT